ncbi:MAG: protein kinase [Planctomycetes bacterium]|nr:protein kinase [Planctomycetota bacterium]
MLSFIRFDKKPYRWLINQAHRRWLEDNLIGKEPLIYDAASKNIFKNNSARTIFPMDLSGMNLIVKRYKIKNWLEMLKATFISKARQEVKSSAHLIQQHVDTAYPLGVLEKRHYGFTTDVFVFLKKIDGVVSLKEFLNKPLSMEAKDNLLNALGEFIRKVHQARFFHKDLHIGNILIESSSLEAEAPRLYLIDLHRSSIQPHFTQAYGMYNLAQMVYSLSSALPLTDAYRFIRAYRELDFRRRVFRDFVRTVFTMVGDLRHKHWQARNKKCLKNSSAYTRVKVRNKIRWENVFISRHYNYDDISRFIECHDKMASQEPNKLFKYTKNHSISCIRNGSADVFIKEYQYSIWNKMLSFLGIHPARKEWFSSSGLNIRYVQTAPSVALVEKKDPFFTWVNKAYMVTKKVEAGPTNQFLMRNFGLRIRDKEVLDNKIRFIKQFALAIKALHQKGIFHHDLKANNVLIANSPTRSTLGVYTEQIRFSHRKLSECAQRDSFYFIDLDRVDFNREVLLDERIKNLAQLNAAVTDVITRTDRLRFYRFYSYGEECLPHKDEKEIIRKIMQATIKRQHFWPPQG